MHYCCGERYCLTSGKDHGYEGWLETQYAPIDVVTSDPQLLGLVNGAAFAIGNNTNATVDSTTLLTSDANADTKARDSESGLFQIPLSSINGKRTGSREFVVAVRDTKHANGTKRYPLDVRLNAHVTKVTFNKTVTPPRATALREIVIAGGAYNSPQLLKLSGIDPAEELEKNSIPVVVVLPGVGTNLQDHYEISVQGEVEDNFSALHNCTFQGDYTDSCMNRYNKTVLGNRGIYASSGFVTAMFYQSSVAEKNNWDIFALGGPVNFRGYFPDYSVNATAVKNLFSWGIFKAHPRNNAGTVTLQSADPLDVPDIAYNYSNTSIGIDEVDEDVTAMSEAIALARDVFKCQLVPINEVLPGKDVDTPEEIIEYIKDNAWGHHASSTCPVGVNDDEMAVLDSNFNVRGTKRLRVVDASVFPRIPGVFTALVTYVVAEKAADVILSAAQAGIL